MNLYDAVIIGGGLAGLQASIQLGRYGHRVLVLDAGTARSELCRRYRNILGYPQGVSGPELRMKGRAQAEQYKVAFIPQRVVKLQRHNDVFVAATEQREHYFGSTVLISTGVSDRIPDIPGMKECLGESIYICPDCDGFEVMNQPVAVIGSGNAGASMALELSYFTDRIMYVNHELQAIEPKLQEELSALGAEVVQSRVASIGHEAGELRQIELVNGKRLAYEKAFIAFGGNQVHSQLGNEVGVRLHHNGHIVTDARTKMTSVEGIWAAGDVALHSEQAVIAMGEGAQAAIWMHKKLKKLGVKKTEVPVLST